jgi:hypothetical protein
MQDMESLLIGLKKRTCYRIVRNSTEHQCIAVQESAEPAAFPTKKVLG